MSKVKNKQAVGLLARRSFAANRTRNLIATAAIALTAVLFTTLFTLGIGAVDNLQQATMRQVGGGGHASLKYIDDATYDKIKDSSLIRRISYNRLLAEEVNNPELLKRHGEFYYMDEAGRDLTFCVPTVGQAPQAENEIITDTKTLQLLGIPQEIGAPLTLELTVHGERVTREFVLSGWWEADPVFNVAMFVTSQAYMDAHMGELEYTYPTDHSMTGVINSYVEFHNSLNPQDKLDRLLTEHGYQSIDEAAGGYVASNINWAYLSSGLSQDPAAIAAVIGALLLVTFTGYLIIYNIFQISVVKDIRFYGLLKTIGATGHQLKTLIRKQALLLSVFGIPIGLVVGFLLGQVLVPSILSGMFNGLGVGTVTVKANPLIFLGSALFALITVYLSTRKPGKLAAAVSPVEATRYTDGPARLQKKEKRTTDGGKLPRMALSNLSRNRKRTTLAVLSMSLSLVILNTVFTLSSGFDMDKYLNKFTDTDYLIAQAEYFNYTFRGPENELSETMIQQVIEQPGFQEGGRIFGNNLDVEHFSVEDPNFSKDASQTRFSSGFDQKGNLLCAVYGVEPLPFSRLEVVEGELDLEKLATGNYIIEGLTVNDYNEPYYSTSHFEIGDSITLHNYKGDGETMNENEYTTRTFTLLAKVKVKSYTASDGVAWDYSYYLPADIYKELVADPGLMSFSFNVEDSQESTMDAFLQQYTEQVEPTMHYSSKASRKNEFRGLQNMVLLIGGALSLIIGLIGILNFSNSILTSIVTRRKEFATLEAVGMTKSQLQKMLVFEGLYYAAFASITSVLLSSVTSVSVIRSLAGGMWFFSYRFLIWPALAALPILLLLAVLVPVLALHYSNRESIVERLRSND